MPKIKCPQGICSVSIAGTEYTPDKKREIEVPDDVDLSSLPSLFDRIPNTAAAEVATAAQNEEPQS